MGPARFHIALEAPTGAFLAGQIISGKVILQLNSEVITQGVTLTFCGEAEVGWQEQTGQGPPRGFQDNEIYFEKTIFLLGDGNSDVAIPPGPTFEYPFRFQLPLRIPSSYEGISGHVRYQMEATVKRSWKFDYTAKLAFNVGAQVDLNLQPVYAEAREVTSEKSIGCLCFKQGHISMRVELPRTGYVPGEYVQFSVHTNNSSSRPITAILVYLIQEISYQAHGHMKRVPEEELSELVGPEVQPFQCDTWQSQFQIPPVPPSNLGGCKLIGISYFVKFQLDIPSSIDLRKKVPIVIGTIPYNNFQGDLQYPNYLPQPQPQPQPMQVVGEGQNQAGAFYPPFNSAVPTAPSAMSMFPEYSSMMPTPIS